MRQGEYSLPPLMPHRGDSVIEARRISATSSIRFLTVNAEGFMKRSGENGSTLGDPSLLIDGQDVQLGLCKVVGLGTHTSKAGPPFSRFSIMRKTRTL